MADRILYERPWCSIILHSKHKIRFVLTNHVTRIDMVRIYLPFVLLSPFDRSSSCCDVDTMTIDQTAIESNSIQEIEILDIIAMKRYS